MNNRKAVFIVCALVVLGVLGYVYYEGILSRQLSSIMNYSKNITRTQTTLKELEGIKNDIHGTRNRIEQMKEDLEALNKAVPDTGSATEFSLQLYYTLKQRELTINNLEAHSITPGKGYYYQEVSIGISGQKKNVLDFISYLQNSSRKIRIRDSMIKIKNEEELDATMKIRVFFLEEK